MHLPEIKNSEVIIFKPKDGQTEFQVVLDGEHDIADEIHVSDNDDNVQRYKVVFRAIFNSNGQLGYYKQMMGGDIDENKTT